MSLTVFEDERLEKAKERVVAYEDAIAFLQINPTKRYKLNTGQSEQEVTRQDIEGLENSLQTSLRLVMDLEQRKNGNRTIHAPLW